MKHVEVISKFVDHLSGYVEFTSADLAVIEECVPSKTYEKGVHLLRAGEVSNAFFFNAKGFVRLYYLQEGQERTAYFYRTGTFISAYTSFIKREPCAFFLQATETTHVAVIGFDSAEKLLNSSPKFETLARLAMEEEMMSLQETIASLLILKPEERYASLLENNPEIFQKVPQIQIASFLGVQPESLSRIKKRLMHRS